MTLAEAVFEVFVHKLPHAYMEKMEKGDNSVMDLENCIKSRQVIYILDTIYDPNIITIAKAVIEIFCSQASICL